MNPDLTLRPNQISDVAFFMVHERGMLLHDPAVGKTPVACAFMWWLWVEKKQCTIWAMPVSLRDKNKEELLAWTGFTDEELVLYDGGPVPPQAKVLLITTERMRRSWRDMVNALPIGLYAVDEWQLGGYRSPKSKRSIELYAAMEKIPRFMPMSGTLISGRWDSAYTAISLIDWRYYVSPEDFVAQHGLLDENGNVTAWINPDKLARIFQKHGVCRSFAEEYGPEAKVIVVETCDMAPKQRKMYDQFEAEALLELEDRFLDGTNPGVATLRCRQIMAHPECVRLATEHDIDGKPIAWKDYDLTGGEMTGKDARLELHFLDHYEKHTQIVTFGVFQTEIERAATLAEKCGLRTAYIHGGVGSTERSRIDRALRSKELDHVASSSDTAGVGFNWGDLDHILFTSLQYKDDSFLQGYRRGIRGVRKKPLLITVLEYRKSVDQPIMRIIERKSADASKVNSNREPIIFRGPN